MTKSRQTPILAAIYFVFLAAWFAIGFLFVPQLIIDAFLGESWPILNSIFEGQETHHSKHYLEAWRRFHLASIMVLAAIPLILTFAKRFCVTYFDRFVGLATPEALGGIRFWVFMILAVNVLWEDLPSVAHLPTQLRVQMGMMSMLHMIPAWDSIYTSYNALAILKIATIAALVFAIIGFKTRWSVPCATILALIHGGILREYCHLYHTCLVSLQVAVALSFMPCGHGLSVDQYLSKKKPADLPQCGLGTYGWSRYICWVIVAGAYVSAGFSKIGNGGIWWWHGTNLKNIVLTDALNPMHFEWGLEHELASVPIGVFSLMGLAAVLIESLYGLVLFSRRARLIMPLLAVGMHLGIWICQGILFFDLILIQLIFFNFSRLLPHKWRTEITIDQQVTSRTQQQRLHKKWFAVCLFVMFGICACWVLRIEKYPATAWQMYSNTDQSQLITYRKVLAVFSDGHKEEAHLEQWIGAFADTRYRDVFRRDERDQQAFFDAVIRLANRDAPRQIVRFEVVTYQWNFKTDANNPDLGAVKSVLTYPSDDVGQN